MQENKSNQPQSSVYSREQYATKQFWDSRYKQKQTYFDWYAQFPQLKQTFQSQYGLTQQNNILMLGCGNSKLSQQMYQAGYHNIVNIDISEAVIQQMQKISKQKKYDKMKWLVMDATNMKQFQNKTFDAVIDKGTLDALISGKNNDICQKMLRQAMRVLKSDGQFILITYGSPQGRKKFFQASIGMAKYDYYFTRVDLSSMSTLINLMRSNLGNKPLNAITGDIQALKKSLMEFNLIKVLRRNRKNQKKLIIWSDLAKQPVEKQQQIKVNQPSKQQNKASINEVQIPQKQPKQQVSNNFQQLKQQQKQEKPKQSEQTAYNPKKQSFCYVYSIKQKFAIDIESVISTKIKQQTPQHYQHIKQQNDIIQVQGDKTLQKISVFAQGCQKQLDKAITYLQLQKIANSPLAIYQNLQNFNKQKDNIKLHIKQGKINRIPALSKSVYQIQIKCQNNKLQKIQQKVQKCCKQLIQNGGLQAHPSPRNYAYIGILMQKSQPRFKFTQYLNKYWYPTYKLISFSNNIAIYQISVSSTLSEIYCIKIFTQFLQILQKNITRINKGYYNYFDPRIISLINFGVVTYCQGQINCLVVDQFGENSSNQQYKQYVDNAVFLKKQTMSYILARLLSAIQ